MTTLAIPTRWVINAADVSDDPDIFPFLPGQGFLQSKTPLWSTKTDTSVSGLERRRALWSYPIWKFRVGYEVLRDDPSALELQRLVTFFNAHSGSFRAFYYFDRSDNAVVGQPFGVGDGVTTSFQLTRTKQIGGITFTEPVKAISGVPIIYANSVAASSYAVGTIGTITFATPPSVGTVLTWTGNFFFRCRFVKDDLDLTQMMSGLWSSAGLELQSVK
jgi:uncharacterized protein (TIGR02217 family)